MGTSLARTARDTAEKYDMLPPGAVVVALVSGGADSVGMLRLLVSGELGGPFALSVLHVDHMLRPDSGEDARFVERTCAELGVECRIAREDVGALAEAEALNLEDAGRRVRYRIAEDEMRVRCEQAGVDPSLGRIAVAHSLDDRIETFLMRVLTGAGAGALASIRHRRGPIVRPLLDVRRDDIRTYLTALGQEWREDVTNLDIGRLRARVRHTVLPPMLETAPAFPTALARTLDLLAAEDALLDSLAEEASLGAVEVSGAHDTVQVRFDRVRVSAMPRSLALRVVRSALLGAFPEASRLESAHVEALTGGMTGSMPFAHDLPEGLKAWSEYGIMVVSRTAEVARSVAPGLLSIPGEVDLGPTGVLSAEMVEPGSIVDDPYSAFLDASKIHGDLTVDHPREGDRMRPFGMTGTRKLQDLLTDAKVPKRQRPATPVVRDGDTIVWLAGVRASEDHRVGPETRRVVRLSWRREE